MLDFKDVNKLIEYNWSNFFNNCEPKGNSIILTKIECERVKSNTFIRILGEIIGLIGTLIFQSFLLNLGNKDVSFIGVSAKFSPLLLFKLVLIFILFGYFITHKDKEQKTYIYLVLIALIFINTIGLLLSIIGFLSALFYQFIGGILGLISVIISLKANIGLVSVFIDICERAKHEYDEKNTVKTMDDEIKMKPIDINDVSDHTIKKCAYCGNEVSNTANYCKFCGSKLQN